MRPGQAAPSGAAAAQAAPKQDLDLHGVVGIRVMDAGEADLAVVRRQLGLPWCSLDREPDIVVRFVDRVTSRPLTHVGVGATGFNDDGFFVSKGTTATSPLARVPFERIGRQPEIICERGITAVPHLLAIINLTALAKGVLPLHASAFTLDSIGVLVTGWAKGGKTETLLACMRRGARYVGDEWVFLADGQVMLGLPEPIRLWAWHLRQLPQYLQPRPQRDRMRLSMWRTAAAVASRAGETRVPGAALVRKATPAVRRQAYLQVPPTDLFGRQAVALRGRLDIVVMVEAHAEGSTRVEPTTGADVARRMAASLVWERAAFMDHYLQHRYAHPDAVCDLVERAPDLEHRLLDRFLAARPAIRVLHPYPCDIDGLGAVVASAAADAMTGPPRGGP